MAQLHRRVPTPRRVVVLDIDGGRVSFEEETHLWSRTEGTEVEGCVPGTNERGEINVNASD